MDFPLSLAAIGIAAAFYRIIAATQKRSASRASVIHFALKPAFVSLKRTPHGDQQESTDKVSLADLVASQVPSLYKPFQPVRWLFNGHLQTIYCVFGDFTKQDRITYNRTYLRLADNGTLGLDFTPQDQSNFRPDTPIIVVMHGLTGGSYEAYVRAILHPACLSVEEGGLGYRAVVVNFRGCAGVPLTTQQLYSAGHTDDFRQALAYITYLYPTAPLLGLGFSLGANVLTRYVAEEGDRSRLSSACALACPWDLEENNRGLMNSLVGYHIYHKGMGGNLKKLLLRHSKILSVDPDHPVAQALLDVVKLKNPTLAQFDETFTRVAGGSPPIFPFPSAEAYYRWASSHYVVKDIKVPFLSINSTDDPVVRYVPTQGGDNEYIVMALTNGGGHLGWFESRKDHIGRWVTAPVIEWMKLTGDIISTSAPLKASGIYVDSDGFIREEGRPQLGCRRIPGGGLIDANGGEAGMLQGL